MKVMDFEECKSFRQEVINPDTIHIYSNIIKIIIVAQANHSNKTHTFG